MRKGLKQIGALCLALTLFVSLLPAGLFPAASAADVSALGERPKLHVHFLGDNAGNGNLVEPVGGYAAPQDQHVGGDYEGTWGGYPSTVAADGATIFWLGVGIDNLANFDLTKGQDGLFSGELGFYYNSEFVRPYTGGNAPDTPAADAAFSEAVTVANQALWGNNFVVREALQNLPVLTETVTEEFNPTNPLQLSPSGTKETEPDDWRMTYVSIDKESGDNRLRVIGTEETQYLLLIPFEVLQYDSEDKERLCIRLVRNATHFSLGAGEGGEAVYGAWEQKTRNSGHNLKDMLVFQGDLNIWTGEYAGENIYKAILSLKDPTPGDSAVLSVANQVPPIAVSKDGDKITELAKGIEMFVDVTCAAGNLATVLVESDEDIELTAVSNIDGVARYSYIMPTSDTSVTVTFSQSVESTTRRVDLTTTQTPATTPLETGAMLRLEDKEGNSLKAGDSLLDVPIGSRIEILLDYNSDYDVKLRAENAYGTKVSLFAQKENESYYFTMPSENVRVYVDYVRADEYDMQLFVPATSLGAGDVSYRAQGQIMMGNGATRQTQVLSPAAELGQNSIDVRDGRRVYIWVAMPDEGILQAHVSLIHLDGNGLEETLGLLVNEGANSFTDEQGKTLGAAALEAGYGYYASFVMPAYHVQAKVEFAPREERAVELNLSYNSTSDPSMAAEENNISIEGYGLEGLAKTNRDGEEIEVFTGNMVTGRYELGEEYEIESIEAYWWDNSSGKPLKVAIRVEDKGEGIFTFPVSTTVQDDEKIYVQVNVREKRPDSYTLLAILEPGIGIGDNNFKWKAPNGGSGDMIHTAIAGEQVSAEITVGRGYYLETALLYSHDEFFDFERTGNGYNNGAGGTVNVSFTMPKLRENGGVLSLFIRLVRGLPPAEPLATSGLVVSDPAYDDDSGSENNKAYIKAESVSGGDWLPTAGLTGRDSLILNGAAAMTRIHPQVGELVTVKVDCLEGHYVKEVRLSPDNVNVPYVWLGEDTFCYKQPIGDVGVNIEFAKLEEGETEPPEKLGSLTVHQEGSGTFAVSNLTTNELIAPADYESLPVGTQVKLEATAAGGQYIQHLAAAAGVPGATARSDNTAEDSITFYIQEDTHAYLTFAADNGGAAIGNQTIVELRGPVGSGVLTWQEQTDGVVGVGDTLSVGEQAVRIGNAANRSMALKVFVQADYCVQQVIVYGSAQPQWTDSTSMSFDMGTEDSHVIVVLAEDTQALSKHLVNLVLRPPTGYTSAEAGEGGITGGDYSKNVTMGEAVSAWASAKAGFYIERVEVVPTAYGAAITVTGDQARQALAMRMPDGDVQINVYFAEGWPGEASHQMYLHVNGDSGSGTAALHNSDQFRQADSDEVSPGGKAALAAWDGDPMSVTMSPAAGCQIDWTRLRVTDAGGGMIPYVITGENAIAFSAPNTETHVTVYYRDAASVGKGSYNARFYQHEGGKLVGAATNASGSKVSTTTSDDLLSAIPAGNVIDLTATAESGYELVRVVAYGAGGEPLPFHVNMTEGASGIWTGSLVMPNEHITVQAFFRAKPTGGAEAREQLASLVMLGAPASGTSAKGTILNTNTNSSASVALNASPGNNPGVLAHEGDSIQISVALTGRVVSGIYALDDDGQRVDLEVVYQSKNYSLTMPEDSNVIVYLETSASGVGKSFTTQLVVDSGGNAENKAYFGTAANPLTSITAEAGEEVTVEFVVSRESEIRDVTITPTRHNGAISARRQDASTGTGTTYHATFIMPADDTILFVRFGENMNLQRSVTLRVTHDDKDDEGNLKEENYGSENNKAWLYTADSAASAVDSGAEFLPGYEKKYVADPNYVPPADLKVPDSNGNYTDDGAYASVTSSAPQKEVVLVKVGKAAGYYPSLRITTVPASDIPVYWIHGVDADMTLFAVQMPARAIEIDVVYTKNEPTTRAYLHMETEEAQPADGGTASLTYPHVGAPTSTTDENGGYIEGLPSDWAKLEAKAAAGYYIEHAFVMYKTIMLDLLNRVEITSADKKYRTSLTADFVLQPEDAHVYVVYKKIEEPDLEEREYTAALSVVGPKDMVPGRAGAATMRSGDESVSSDSDALYTFTIVGGEGEGKGTACEALPMSVKPGDRVLITVNPNIGFKLDSIIFTPLVHGDPQKEGYTPPTQVELFGSGLNYHFTMPERDVGVVVFLALESLEGIYDATIHITEINETGASTTETTSQANYAHIKYLTQVADAEGETIYIPYNETVLVEVHTEEGYYLESAYALSHTRDGTQMNVLHPFDGILEAQDTAGPKENITTYFVMPEADADVFFVFHHEGHVSQPVETVEYTAAITMSDVDDTPNKDSSATLGRSGKATDTVTVQADGNIKLDEENNVSYRVERSITAASGETMRISLDLDAVAGNELEKIIITPRDGGGQEISPTQNKEDPSEYTFTMPAHNVSIYIMLKKGNPPASDATLRIIDRSAAIGNGVTMSYGAQSVSTDGATITDIPFSGRVNIAPKLQAGVSATVLYSSKEGTFYATDRGSYYEVEKMPAGDITVTVIFENTVSAADTYIARVETPGRGTNLRNTVSIENTTTLSMPEGEIWTMAAQEDELLVSYAVAAGYRVAVTAKTDAATPAAVPVRQFGEQGAGYAVLAMPSADVVIFVEYIRVEPSYKKEATVSLAVVGGTTGSEASLVRESGSSITATVGGTETDSLTANLEERLTLTVSPTAGDYVKEITLTSGETKAVIYAPDGTAELSVPTKGGKITVTFGTGAQTLRPYDPTRASAEGGYEAGHLTARENQNRLITIPVPVLGESEDTYSSTGAVEYALYYQAADHFVKLVSKAENATSYDYEVVARTKDELYGAYTGDTLVLRVAEGWSPLSIIAKEGGTLYISAKAVDKAESGMTEVFVPESEGSYTATLQIIDLTGSTGNSVQMSDGSRVKSKSGEILTGLTGTEQIRTVVRPAAMAEVVAVMVTDSQGSHLFSGPFDASNTSDGQRYPWFMNNENIVVTVIFGRQQDDYLTAAVQLAGDDAQAENTAAISNLTREELPDGTIWTVAKKEDILRLEVTTAAGYYATVTAVDKNGETVDVIQYGVTGGFYALTTMPNENVQITVSYTMEKPPMADGLTAHFETAGVLEQEEPAADARSANRVKIQAGGGEKLELIGKATTVEESEEAQVRTGDLTVAAGEKVTLDLSTAFTTTSPLKYWYAESITLAVGARTPVITVPITDQTASFTMPYAAEGETVTLTVTYGVAETSRSFRPHDYKYDKNIAAANGYVEGFIQSALPTMGADGREAAVVIPTRFDIDRYHSLDEGLWESAMTDSERIGYYADAYDIPYTFYWRDAYGNDHQLVPDTDILLDYLRAAEAEREYCYPIASQTGSTYRIAVEKFTIRAVSEDSVIAKYLAEGGVIYVAAKENDRAASDKVEIVIPENYTVTLKVADSSSAQGEDNRAYLDNNAPAPAPSTMEAWHGHDAVQDGFRGEEEITVSHSIDTSNSKVAAVLKTDRGGTEFLPAGTEEYTDTLNHQDVTYTSVIIPHDADIMIAAVKLDDEAQRRGNTASIQNTTTPGLSAGDIWAAAELGDYMTVNVSAEPGYYALVEATLRSEPKTELKVLQWGATGSFTAHFYMPDGTEISKDDVQVTITYSTEPLEGHHLTLTMHMDGAGEAKGENISSVTIVGENGAILVVQGAYEGTDITETSNQEIQAGYDLLLESETHEDYYVDSVTLVVGGGDFTFTYLPNLGKVDFVMPFDAAEVIVTYKPGIRTGKPYDEENVNSSVYQLGYVDAWRADAETLRIDVPALTKDGLNMTSAYLTDGADSTGDPLLKYMIYLRDPVTGELIPMDDGECEFNLVSNQQVGKGYVGAYVDVTLTGNGAHAQELAQAIQNRDLIYITAERIPTAAEAAAGISYVVSEYQEVVIQKRGFYTASIEPVVLLDNSFKRPEALLENQTDNKTVYSNAEEDECTIKDLEGGESMQGALTAVAMAEAGLATSHYLQAAVLYHETQGSLFLPRDMEDDVNYLYPFTMPEDNVVLTLVADRNPEPESETRYVAAVQVLDAAEPQIEKSVGIENRTEESLSGLGGKIWVAGYEGNLMRVDFDLTQTDPDGAHFGEDYYALVTAYNADTEDPIDVMQLGAQTGYAMLMMPAANVQVVVTISDKPPVAGLLTLELFQEKTKDGVTSIDENHKTDVSVPENKAVITQKRDGTELLSVNHTITTAGTEEVAAQGNFKQTTDEGVAADEALHLTAEGRQASAGTNYYVKQVYLEVGDVRVELGITDDMADFVMPVNSAHVSVIYAEGTRTHRPYDPRNLADVEKGHLLGHLVAEAHGADTSENYSATVAVPTLYHAASEPTLSDANGNHYFQFSYYDESANVYVPLRLGTDITVYARNGDALVSAPPYNEYTMNYSEEDYEGAEFVIQVPKGSPTYESFKEGMVLYITALEVDDLTADPIVPADGKVESERTQLIIPQPSKGYRPYDPSHAAGKGYYREGYIYSENRKDYGVITVPTVKPGEGNPEDIDPEKVRFVLHLDTEEEKVSLEPVLNYWSPTYDQTRLPSEQLPYETGTYYTGAGSNGNEVSYEGIRFAYGLKTDVEIADWYKNHPIYGAQPETERGALIAEAQERAEELADTLFETPTDSAGAGETINKRMYISVVEIQENIELYSEVHVEVELRSYYTLTGKLEGYQQVGKETTFTFYPFTGDSEEEGALAVEANYAAEPVTVLTYAATSGKGFKAEEFAIHSDLLRAWNEEDSTAEAGIFRMVIERAGHVPYTWVGMTLDDMVTDKAIAESVEVGAETPAYLSDADSNRHHSIKAVIPLWGGDITGDGFIDADDRVAIDRLINFTTEYTWEAVENATPDGWNHSIYNPYSLAFAANFDGDVSIDQSDKNVILNERNYGKSAWSNPPAPVAINLDFETIDGLSIEALEMPEGELPLDLENPTPEEPTDSEDDEEIPTDPDEEAESPEPNVPVEPAEPEPQEPTDSEDDGENPTDPDEEAESPEPNVPVEPAEPEPVKYYQKTFEVALASVDIIGYNILGTNELSENT